MPLGESAATHRNACFRVQIPQRKKGRCPLEAVGQDGTGAAESEMGWRPPTTALATQWACEHVCLQGVVVVDCGPASLQD